jgi:hypothetical protein
MNTRGYNGMRRRNKGQGRRENEDEIEKKNKEIWQEQKETG